MVRLLVKNGLRGGVCDNDNVVKKWQTCQKSRWWTWCTQWIIMVTMLMFTTVAKTFLVDFFFRKRAQIYSVYVCRPLSQNHLYSLLWQFRVQRLAIEELSGQDQRKIEEVYRKFGVFKKDFEVSHGISVTTASVVGGWSGWLAKLAMDSRLIGGNWPNLLIACCAMIRWILACNWVKTLKFGLEVTGSLGSVLIGPVKLVTSMFQSWQN